jgi:PIN domain nuclease of toxin-antitoxin system
MVTIKINNPNPQFSKAHLTSLNLNNLKMIEAIGLKLLHRGPIERHYFRTKFHENLISGSEILTGGYTDRQTYKQTDW